MVVLTRKLIDNVGHRFRKFSEKAGDREIIQAYRQLRCTNMDILFQQIGVILRGCPGVLSCRVKRIETIIRKLRRERSMDLSRMDDIVAFRIIVSSQDWLRRVETQLKSGLAVRKSRDYIASVPASGYRAIHLTVDQTVVNSASGTNHSFPCEIQLRTFFQHIWSTTSESFGEQVKEGGGSEEIRTYLKELSQKIESYEKKFLNEEQIKGLNTSISISFIVIVFDKKTGIRTLTEYFGTNLGSAIKRVLYFEDAFRANFEKEVVLIGLPTGESDARITHMRYFCFSGIPEIPDVICPVNPRPARQPH